jgi:hypothetical protein
VPPKLPIGFPKADDAGVTLLELIRSGAVLTPAVPDPVRFLLAPVAVVHEGRLHFFDLIGDRVRTLKYDREEREGERVVWLVQAGDRVAGLTAVIDESNEAQDAWRLHWDGLADPEQQRQQARFEAALAESLVRNGGNGRC